MDKDNIKDIYFKITPEVVNGNSVTFSCENHGLNEKMVPALLEQLLVEVSIRDNISIDIILDAIKTMHENATKSME